MRATKGTRRDLLARLRVAYNLTDKIDNELHRRCKRKIDPLVTAGRFDDAKDIIREYFKGYERESFARDTLFHYVNVSKKERDGKN